MGTNTIFFKDDDNFLSNSSDHPFELDGYIWPTVEHYFQANKYVSNQAYFEEVRLAKTPREAFHVGRKYQLIQNWNKTKDFIMKKALIAKFKTHHEIRFKLLDTNDLILIKDNSKDNYWGYGNDGLGKNILGILLMEVRNIFKNTCVLESEESYKKVSVEDIIARYEIGIFFMTLPKDFFSGIQYFEPISGCFNNCAFCSQNAEKKVTYYDIEQLKNTISSLKFISLKMLYNEAKSNDFIDINGVFSNDFIMPNHGIIGDPSKSSPGMIYCYFDGDVSIYPYLYEYIKYCFEDLGLKTRIATIGYSSNNKQIQSMHEMINKDAYVINALGGIRLSYSVYTPGWIGKEVSLSRDEFINDTSNFLKTYKPTLDSLGIGEKKFRVELRFPPLIKRGALMENIIEGHHVLRCCNYLLICIKPNIELKLASIVRSKKHSASLDAEGIEYLLINSDYLNDDNWHTISSDIIANNITIKKGILKNYLSRRSLVFLLENADGEYFAVDPSFQNNHMFVAKQFYPSNKTRRNSGFIDSERFFLNNLLLYKFRKGLGAQDPFENADWNDVDNVMNLLKKHMQKLEYVDSFASNYMNNYIIPLVSSYTRALKLADYPPSYFFDKNFTIDTGQICNLGRAINEYRMITDKSNMPVTPQQEKSFGINSTLAYEGIIWRLSLKNKDGSNYIYVEKQNLENIWTDKNNLNKRVIANYKFKLDAGITIDKEWENYKIPGYIKNNKTQI